MSAVSNTPSVPYYQDEAVTLYHGDAREILPLLVSQPTHLLLTDPPYNLGIEYGSGTDDSRVDYEQWCREWFAFTRILCERRAVSTGHANVGMWWRIEEPRWTFAWHKPAAMGRCAVGFNNWEPVLYWGPGFSTLSDVFTAPIIPSEAISGHPCPKPLKWATKLVVALSKPGETVLDPFAGSGTTLRAAKDTGRKAIGIEIEKAYCELIVERLAQEVLAVA